MQSDPVTVLPKILGWLQVAWWCLSPQDTHSLLSNVSLHQVPQLAGVLVKTGLAGPHPQSCWGSRPGTPWESAFLTSLWSRTRTGSRCWPGAWPDVSAPAQAALLVSWGTGCFRLCSFCTHCFLCRRHFLSPSLSLPRKLPLTPRPHPTPQGARASPLFLWLCISGQVPCHSLCLSLDFTYLFPLSAPRQLAL